MGVAPPRRVIKNFVMARWGYGFAGAICCLALQLGAVAQSVSYSAGSQESQLVSLERLWNEAQVHRDSQALGSMIADKFLNTEWDGEVSDRGKFLADVADPVRVHFSGHPGREGNHLSKHRCGDWHLSLEGQLHEQVL